MSSAPAHRSVSNIRPSPSPNPTGPGTPHTPPPRVVSGSYGSPSTLRAEEETIVLEIGTRYLRAGSAGDAFPQAVIGYGPEEQRRAGDYRQWDHGYEQGWRRRQVGYKDWGERHELWKLDLRETDLGLVGDKISRAIREAYTKFLLIDSRPRRMVLVLPSMLPLPLLSTMLDILFQNFQPPTISLLPSPTLATFAAGLRAALVVDIGWAETVITGVYEYREIQSYRSIRASKWLGQEMLKTLALALQAPSTKQTPETEQDKQKYRNIISFEECEDITYRMAWCKPLDSTQHSSDMSSLDLNKGSTVSIPLKSTSPPMILTIPFSQLSEPCEATFFAPNTDPSESDDHNLPLPTLLYRTLLRLPIDVRSLCLPRLIFTGGASHIPGLKSRILSSLQKIIDERGWDPVVGKAADALRAKQKERKVSLQRNRQTNAGPSEVPDITNPETEILQPPPIISGEDELHELQASSSQDKIKSYTTLGPWTGASLLTSLKIPSVSIIERETWMSQGLGGAKRIGEMDFSGMTTGKRQSMGAGVGLGRGGVAGDRSSWTLGGFGL